MSKIQILMSKGTEKFALKAEEKLWEQLKLRRINFFFLIYV
jgi:hypothetical protein